MSDELRRRIISIARQELGPHGKGSPQVIKYCRSALSPSLTDAQVRQAAGALEYCGVFTLFCLHEAGVATDVFWKLGSGYVLEQRLPKTSAPLPGDIAIKPVPFWHHALVESLSDGMLYTIDGNQPGVVAKARPAPTRGMMYYSIEPLLMRATGQPVAAPTAPAITPPPRPLRLGSTGDDVMAWQRLLVGRGHKLVVDGSFGPVTVAATKRLQVRLGLDPDGIVGAMTRKAAGLSE